MLNPALAANLLFDPTTVNLPINQSIEIKVFVDAGADQITSSDAYVLYDANLISVKEVRNGAMFPTVTSDHFQTGKVYIAGMVDDPTTYKTGKDILATIVFEGKNNGQTTLTFDCVDGATNESNITKKDINAPDIIQCGLNNRATIIVGQGGARTNTSGSGTQNNQLPRSGIFDKFEKYSFVGVILLLIGITTKLIF